MCDERERSIKILRHLTFPGLSTRGECALGIGGGGGSMTMESVGGLFDLLWLLLVYFWNCIYLRCCIYLWRCCVACFFARAPSLSLRVSSFSSPPCSYSTVMPRALETRCDEGDAWHVSCVASVRQREVVRVIVGTCVALRALASGSGQGYIWRCRVLRV